MKHIESVEDLLRWANEVNTIVNDKNRCDYQDIYARSNREDLDRFFIESNGNRALIICSVRNTMAFEEVEHLLTVLAHYKANKQMEVEYAELDKRESALAAQERAFRDSMKPYHKRLETLRRRNDFLERSFAQLQSQEACAVENMREAKREAKELQTKASKYDTIRELLA